MKLEESSWERMLCGNGLRS